MESRAREQDLKDAIIIRDFDNAWKQYYGQSACVAANIQLSHQDMKRLLPDVIKLAKNDDVHAQFSLSLYYAQAADKRNCLDWTVRAAIKHHAVAMVNLGFYFLYGKLDLKPNQETAVRYFALAALSDDEDARKTLHNLFSANPEIAAKVALYKVSDEYLERVQKFDWHRPNRNDLLFTVEDLIRINDDKRRAVKSKTIFTASAETHAELMRSHIALHSLKFVLKKHKSTMNNEDITWLREKYIKDLSRYEKDFGHIWKVQPTVVMKP